MTGQLTSSGHSCLMLMGRQFVLTLIFMPITFGI